MAVYISNLKLFILESGEINFAIPQFLPGTTTPTPSNANISGNSLANTLTGDSSDNTLDGLGGADRLIGGQGHDSYVVDDPGDMIEENPDEGIDSVSSRFSFVLSENFENLQLLGSDDINGTGNGLGNYIIGNDGNNILDGGAGNDYFQGGLGADQIKGGSGIDRISFAGATAGVIVSLATGTGSGGAAEGDTYSGIENVVGTWSADHLIGDGGDNILEGLRDNDRLDGGAGNDTLDGGAGNDIFYVDSSGDVAKEGHADFGTDLVIASIDYALGTNVEHLTAASGTTALKLTGNELANAITGNAASNALIGKEGNDTLDGGKGDDQLDGGTGTNTALFSGTKADYVIIKDAAGIITVTDKKNGRDGVDVLKNISLAKFADLTFDLTQMSAGTNTGAGNGTTTPPGYEPKILIGTKARDVLTGGLGNDTLYGRMGADVLTGRAGKDVFVFDTKPNAKTNLDRVTDFSVKDDTLWLDNAVFKKLGKGSEAAPGKLNKKFFVVGKKAEDGNDYLIYDNKSGKLLYDGDGSGTKVKAVEIAQLSKNLKMTSLDILVV